MASQRFNLRNPAVKRILQEMKELQASGSREFAASVLEDNLFEWHFVVRGPPDTEFEGGIYHGRILLPPEYPFKPPSFMMLTQNGRFETGVKICLSISSHHPEHWQPSWSVRTALTALIAFMPTPGNGAIGSMDYTKEERKDLARKSRLGPPSFGSAERQKVSQELHETMIAAEQQVSPEAEDEHGVPGISAAREAPAAQEVPPAASAPEPAQAPADGPRETAHELAVRPAELPAQQPPSASAPAPAAAPPDASAPGGRSAGSAAATGSAGGQGRHWAQAAHAEAGPGAAALLGGAVTGWEDMTLTLLAGVLAAAIAALLLRRVLIVAGIDPASPL